MYNNTPQNVRNKQINWLMFLIPFALISHSGCKSCCLTQVNHGFLHPTWILSSWISLSYVLYPFIWYNVLYIVSMLVEVAVAATTTHKFKCEGTRTEAEQKERERQSQGGWEKEIGDEENLLAFFSSILVFFFHWPQWKVTRIRKRRQGSSS